MTFSKRVINAKSDRYNKNVTQRGVVTETLKPKKTSMPVGPVLLGFILFVVLGSSLLQIVQQATSGPKPPV